MLYVVMFKDNPKKLRVRLTHMSRHLAFLRRYRREILVAGSLRKRADGNPEGAMWIVEAKTKQRVEDLIGRDAFFRAGLRKSVTIRLWFKAFARRRLV